MDDKKYEMLSKYIDAVINKDDDAASAAFLPFIEEASKPIVKTLRETAKTDDKAADGDDTDEDADDEDDGSRFLKNRAKKKQQLKKMKKLDEAAILKELHGEDSPVQLKGDDVYISGKMVGTITNDLSNIDSGIVFTSVDGNFKQEFDSIRELYAFLVDKFNIADSVLDSDDAEF